MAPSLAHRPRTRVTLSPPPAQSGVSYNRAAQAIELTKKLREDRRRESVSQPQPSPEPARSSRSSSTAMPPLIPGTPDAAGTPRATRETRSNRGQDDTRSVDDLINMYDTMSNSEIGEHQRPARSPATGPVLFGFGRGPRSEAAGVGHLTSQEDNFEVPVVYEGTDEECSFCREPHRDGDRVVRLACRHVFHSECWHRWSDTRPNRCCPNCRGAGVCIAVWRYMGPGANTQLIGGNMVPNEL